MKLRLQITNKLNTVSSSGDLYSLAHPGNISSSKIFMN